MTAIYRQRVRCRHRNAARPCCEAYHRLSFCAEVLGVTFADIQSQAPQAICELTPTNVSRILIVNRSKPPFEDPEIRRALALSLDRKAFIDTLNEGKADIGGAMLPPPEGLWGMPPEMLRDLPGYDPDVGKSRA